MKRDLNASGTTVLFNSNPENLIEFSKKEMEYIEEKRKETNLSAHDFIMLAVMSYR